jgi:signal transduction histidine kinase
MDNRPNDWLVEERAALQRLAVIVAAGTPPDEVFAAVTEEVGRLLGADVTGMEKYEHGTATLVGLWTRTVRTASLPPLRMTLGGNNVTSLVFRTRQPARIDDYRTSTGDPAEKAAGFLAQDVFGYRAVIGVPISVEGRLWGVMIIGSFDPLPSDAEQRLAVFTDLVGVAIADGQARMDLVSIAEKDAALRRVATLVARGARPEEVFTAVAEEAGQLASGDYTVLSRYDHDESATVVGLWSRTGAELPIAVGERFPLGDHDLTTLVYQSNDTARIDEYTQASGEAAEVAHRAGVRGGVGVPIAVEGRLWGVLMLASTRDSPLPADVEARLSGFTELLATAVANAQARLELRGFAEEQAALRRVATLVARSAEPEAVFTTVAEEVGHLLGVGYTVVSRYDSDDVATVVGGWADLDPGRPFTIGLRLTLEGRNMHTLVHQTRRPARIDDYGQATGAFAETARDWDYRAAVGVPINVDDRVWGVMIAGSRTDPLPERTEERLANFTELVATAIANAQARAALSASRARIVAAADSTRRRIERDLHDGAQQRLVSLALHLRETQAMIATTGAGVQSRLDELASGLVDVLTDLREIARGIHPAGLAERGIAPALRTLAARSAVPVTLQLGYEGRFPEPIEIAVYYGVAEALTNAAKHADASAVEVRLSVTDSELVVGVRDDGRGGAEPAGGSGLVGLKDRVESLGGRLSLASPPGAGTAVEIALPLASPQQHADAQAEHDADGGRSRDRSAERPGDQAGHGQDEDRESGEKQGAQPD